MGVDVVVLVCFLSRVARVRVLVLQLCWTIHTAAKLPNVKVKQKSFRRFARKFYILNADLEIGYPH